VRTLAVLVAAGRGERMGAPRPKAFVLLDGQPLLVHAARALSEAKSVDAIVAVVPGSELHEASRLLESLKKVVAVVEGGARRQDSVLEGMKEAPDDFDGIVLVHDAARALVEPRLVDAVAEAASASGAALPMLPIADTVKRVDGGRVLETLERSTLGSAQTPQGFRFALLARAYEAAFRDRVALTDEAMAVERLGERVVTVPGSERNRKLTTPEDLLWAEDVLRREARVRA
jgi:2-C-methyl-D-erythritol 4-phosphate cytidylyltransferase